MESVTNDRVERLVIDTLAGFGPDPATLTRTATLEDVDLDSLDVVEMAQILEDELDVEIDPERYEGVLTIGDLIDRTVVIVNETREE